LKKILVIASVSGSALAISVAVLAFMAANPTQDYALSVDPVLVKGGGGTETHVTIKNTGKHPVTNVKIDYGGKKQDLIPVINPGQKIILSPPDGSGLIQVNVTADDGINIVAPYRTPVNAPLIGNGGFGQ
jgi:uncharacterized membrane protein